MMDSESTNAWAELENNPEFQKALLGSIVGILLEKKFGSNFIGLYFTTNLLRRLSEIQGKDINSTHPMPEGSSDFERIQEEFKNCTSIPELLLVAKANNIISGELTREDLERARKDAVEFVARFPQ